MYRTAYISLLCCLLAATPAAGGQELISFIETALRQSDMALDIQDSRLLSELDVAGARHQFTTRIVPLTSVGFTDGTGAQQVGLEFRKAMTTGTSVAYGVLGDRIDEDSNFVVENSHSARAYVRLRQGLLRRWGTEYNTTDIDVAEIRDQQSAIDAENALQSLILLTANRYYSLVLEDQLLVISREALTRSKRHLDSAIARQGVGLVSKVDVYRAELAMLTAESSLQEQIRQRDRAVDAFREQLRLAEDEELTWHKEIERIVPVLPLDWDEAIYDNRLDYQSFLLRKQAAEREQYRLERNLLPDLDISVIVEQRGEGNSVEDAVELDQTNWSVQLEMLSSFDTFNEESSLVRKKVELAKLRREGAALRRQIRREVQDGLADLQTAERQHQVNLRLFQQAELALDLAQIRYEKGLSDNLDLLDAESALRDAELAISRSLAGYNTAAIQLADVLGILSLDWLRESVR